LKKGGLGLNKRKKEGFWRR